MLKATYRGLPVRVASDVTRLEHFATSREVFDASPTQCRWHKPILLAALSGACASPNRPQFCRLSAADAAELSSPATDGMRQFCAVVVGRDRNVAEARLFGQIFPREALAATDTSITTVKVGAVAHAVRRHVNQRASSFRSLPGTRTCSGECLLVRSSCWPYWHLECAGHSRGMAMVPQMVHQVR